MPVPLPTRTFEPTRTSEPRARPCTEAPLRVQLPCAEGSLAPRAPLRRGLPCAEGSLAPRAPLRRALPCAEGSLAPRAPMRRGLRCAERSLAPSTPFRRALFSTERSLAPRALNCATHLRYLLWVQQVQFTRVYYHSSIIYMASEIRIQKYPDMISFPYIM
jgi:hypothetical protein